MPGSYHYYKKEVKDHLIKTLDFNANILDVGPGYGTYGNLLKPEFINIDAVEIWEKYVDQFKLKEIYRNVYIENILNFNFSYYDYLIIGDVLEHLDIKSSQKLLKQIYTSNKKCLVAVPYNYPQGPHEDNIYETHLQPDLTHEIFLERYSSMKELFRNDKYGYYINY
jgi:hypothetical protein